MKPSPCHCQPRGSSFTKGFFYSARVVMGHYRPVWIWSALYVTTSGVRVVDIRAVRLQYISTTASFSNDLSSNWQ